ncbi:tubulointerstitial nephritis antigen-like [Lutzomyia longipalpis]|uniref:Putative cysteine proteinase tin-ag n=1 Tax=Lutzomyia longipalpis TaxID=7200 RepID=A0A7G3AAH1_LUTLO|nr:tubulointerstitial nephritis antigen-like [Lutzomyia longipalpis]
MALSIRWSVAGVVCLLAILQPLLAQYDDFPGPYCADSRYGGCCNSRQDTCAVPISTTLCYCDEFCNRTTNSDCCPDYQEICLGIPPPAPILGCHHNGIYFTQFDAPIKDNCNLCRCQPNGQTLCDRDVCLVDEHLLHTINSGYNGWRATNYTEFWGRKLSDGLDLRLGTFEPTYPVKAMTRLTNRRGELARSFDARDQWPGFVTHVVDQGWCGSSWAVSTTSVASDRFAILSKGKEVVQLAPQQLLSCVRKQRGCNGGHLDVAWNYLRRIGVANDECYPYEASRSKCRVHRGADLVSLKCQLPSKVPRQHFYQMGPAYSLNNETDIMAEIQRSGPVQATMRVYRDFFSYSGGIYRHTQTDNSDKGGFHSVRIVGWGEEQEGYSVTKYWIAANSWGTWWGEDGYFRILRGTNECEIENYVLASWADVFTKQKSLSQTFARRRY